MQYGDWELRDYSAYWKSPDILMYPTTNSVDEGMLHNEHNVRSVVRRITTKNYALREEHFRLTLSADRKYITVGPGEGNIQGYHIITRNSLTIQVPQDEWLNEQYRGEIKQWTLGISLSYDAANNVTGDVVVNTEPIGDNETFSGAYLYFFDRCQITNNYDKILILGRVWCQNGVVVPDGTTIPEDQGSEDDYDDGRYIEHGIEEDPFKLNAIDGSKVEVQIEGMATTQYDTIPQNISVISQYDSMLHPVEQDRNNYDKPPTFYTDLQTYIHYIGDWYVNKYGDYMTGALRMDHLSIDRKMELDPQHAHEYIKDSSGEKGENEGLYHGTEGIFISPRTLGSLTSKVVNYEDGGTIMTVVPQSYQKGLDYNYGEDSIYAALISRKSDDTGLRLHAADNGYSRLVLYDGTSNLLIENVGNPGGTIETNTDIGSIEFRDGEIFVDSFNGAGIQFYSASPSTSSVRNLDFRIDEYLFSAAEHNNEDHRENTRANKLMQGLNTDTLHIELGLGCSYDNNYDKSETYVDTRDPYLQLDNLRLRSNDVSDIFGNTIRHKLNTIEVVNTGGTREVSPDGILSNIVTENSMPYLRLMPSIYTRNGIAEDYFQVGTRTVDDVIADNANILTNNKIVIGKVHDDTLLDEATTSYTFIEQTIPTTSATASIPQVFTKSVPFSSFPAENSATQYSEIGGIYSFGNIGCSDTVLDQYTGETAATGPYTKDSDWVRFTKFRYDQDNDNQYGGTFTGTHSYAYGNTYNIEFNTTVANRRSNQIIWHYKGGADSTAQPLTLSYIHDEITDYPNDTYVDANGYENKNPTYGVRDFLRLDGGGLSIHGDVNNPALSEIVNGDSRPESEPISRYGITLIQGRIYNAVYNDVAETYKKDDPNEVAIEGMVVVLNPETGKYKISDSAEDKLAVGVISKNYALLLGGKSIDGTSDLIEANNQTEYFAIGISGKIPINVNCDVSPGDLLVTSNEYGLATVSKSITPGTVIGKALSYSKQIEGKPYKQCLMQIMLS